MAPFIELQDENPNDWLLLCIRTGEEWVNKLTHSKIKYLGFIQPYEMKNHLIKKSVYVLPNKFKPWGITFYEFAVTSCPYIF